MIYLTFLPIAILVIFLIVFALIAPRLDRQQRRVWLAFAVGYLLHAFVISSIQWFR